MKGYKLETWKKTKWKGTKREQTTTQKVFVQRDEKGHFKSIITDVKERKNLTGIYYVGYKKGKIKTRKIKERFQKQQEQRIEIEGKTKQMYRTSYVLNNIPISKNGYFGFRIVAFSHNKKLLDNIKEQLKRKLVKWIEKCLKYSQDEFWFDMYFGYESPSISNALLSEEGKYYLTMENKFGMVIKEDNGEISNL